MKNYFKSSNILLFSLIVPLLSMVVSCGNKNSTTNNEISSNSVVIERSADVPVLNGVPTSTGIYVRNSSDKTIDGITYNVEALNDNILLGLDGNSCSHIDAHSSCLLKFTTPKLSPGENGANLLVANFGGKYQTKQLINYNYVDNKLYNGINFSNGDLDLIGHGDYATTYVFVGKGLSQKNVGFASSDSSASVSAGLNNGRVDISSNQVVAIEVKSNNLITSRFVTITPYIVTKTDEFEKNLASAHQVNNILQLSILPAQRANLVMSNFPVLTASESTANVTVVNNGNVTANSISLTSANPTITVSNGATPCGSLVSGASCNYVISIASLESNGSSLLTLGYGFFPSGSGTATQMAYFMVNDAEPMVSSIPSSSNFVENVSSDGNVTFTLHNYGNVPLQNAVLKARQTNLPYSRVSIQNNNCTATISPGETCTADINIRSGIYVESGVVYMNVTGSYTNGRAVTKQYTFASKPLYTNYIDNVRPYVVSTGPESGEINVPGSIGISVNFSKRMQESTLNTSNIWLKKCSDIVPNPNTSVPLRQQSVSNRGQTVTFTQNEPPLEAYTNYCIYVKPDALIDFNGNKINPDLTESLVSIFTTGDTVAPVWTTVTPTDGESNVSQRPNIWLYFSESMNPATVIPANLKLTKADGTSIGFAYTITYESSNFKATINLGNNSLNAFTTYKLQATTGLTDETGNILFNPGFPTTFTTGDTESPELIDVIPANNATDVLRYPPIVLTFNESMNESTINPSTVILKTTSGGVAVPLIGPKCSEDKKVCTFYPSTVLKDGENYTLSFIDTLIKDNAGNSLKPHADSVFTVKSYPHFTYVIGYSHTLVRCPIDVPAKGYLSDVCILMQTGIPDDQWPTFITFNLAGTLAYVTTVAEGTYNGRIYKCDVDLTGANTTGDITGCTPNYIGAAGDGFESVMGITLNSHNTYTYTVANSNPGYAFDCIISGTGDLDSCLQQSLSPNMNSPYAVVLSPNNTKAYITSSQMYSQTSAPFDKGLLYQCDVTESTISNCVATSFPKNFAEESNNKMALYGIAIYRGYAYIDFNLFNSTSSANGAGIASCQIGANGLIDMTTCVNRTSVAFDNLPNTAVTPRGLAVNYTAYNGNGALYITDSTTNDFSGELYVCPLSAGGAVGACETAYLSDPTDVSQEFAVTYY